jgi:hypothetical protein
MVLTFWPFGRAGQTTQEVPAGQPEAMIDLATAEGVQTVLADRYEGKRRNSSNDLIYKSDGTLYFTAEISALPLRHPLIRAMGPRVMKMLETK